MKLENNITGDLALGKVKKQYILL